MDGVQSNRLNFTHAHLELFCVPCKDYVTMERRYYASGMREDICPRCLISTVWKKGEVHDDHDAASHGH